MVKCVLLSPVATVILERSLGTTLNQLLSGELNESRRKYRNLLVVMIFTGETGGEGQQIKCHKWSVIYIPHT